MAILFYAKDNFWSTFSGDDFAGTNGDPPNTEVWEEITNTYGDGAIYSNTMRFYADGVSQPAQSIMEFHSKFTVSGDFDIQIDLNPVTINSDPIIGSFMIDTVPSSNQTWLGYSYNSTFSQYKFWVDGPNTAWSPVVESKINTKLRFVRVGSEIRAMYWNGAAWEWNGSSYLVTGETFTDPIIIGFFSRTEANQILDSNFDNFLINSGTLITP